MKEFRFEKRCSAPLLTFELEQAGFKVVGVSTEDTSTIVYLEDEETKDPIPIVLAHDPEKPLNLALQMAEEMLSAWDGWNNKIIEIAKFLGISAEKPAVLRSKHDFLAEELKLDAEGIIREWINNMWVDRETYGKVIKAVKAKMSGSGS